MTKDTVFLTERTRVTLLKKSDLSDFYEMQGNPQVMQFVKNVMSLNEAKKELDRFIAFYSDNSKLFNIWAIRNTRTDDLLGICGVYKNKFDEFELALRIRKKFWNIGYGTEVLGVLINYCFSIVNINELVAYIYPQNTASIKIAEKYMNYLEDIVLHKNIEKKFHVIRNN